MAELGPYPYPSVCINCGQSSVESLIAHIARLEADLRWCIRGLEDAANARPEHLADWVANLNLERLEYARAGLSDTGEAGTIIRGQREAH